MIPRGRLAPKKYVGETLSFQPLGTRFRTLAAFPFLLFGPTLPQKNTSLRNPSNTHRKSMILASLGPAWGALGGLLGGPRDRLGANKGFPKRRLEAPCAFWISSGGLLGPPWVPGKRFLFLFGFLLVHFPPTTNAMGVLDNSSS